MRHSPEHCYLMVEYRKCHQNNPIHLTELQVKYNWRWTTPQVRNLRQLLRKKKQWWIYPSKAMVMWTLTFLQTLQWPYFMSHPSASFLEKLFFLQIIQPTPLQHSRFKACILFIQLRCCTIMYPSHFEAMQIHMAEFTKLVLSNVVKSPAFTCV